MVKDGVLMVEGGRLSIIVDDLIVSFERDSRGEMNILIDNSHGEMSETFSGSQLQILVDFLSDDEGDRA